MLTVKVTHGLPPRGEKWALMGKSGQEWSWIPKATPSPLFEDQRASLVSPVL